VLKSERERGGTENRGGGGERGATGGLREERGRGAREGYEPLRHFQRQRLYFPPIGQMERSAMCVCCSVLHSVAV